MAVYSILSGNCRTGISLFPGNRTVRVCILFAHLMGIKRAIKEVCNVHFWQQKFSDTTPSGLKLKQLIKWAGPDVPLRGSGRWDLMISVRQQRECPITAKSAIYDKDPQVTYRYKQCTNNVYYACESHSGAPCEPFHKQKMCVRAPK